jgi:hypothetical protein
VVEWLRGLGLEQYVPALRDNDIYGKVLRRLTGEDLCESLMSFNSAAAVDNNMEAVAD